MLQKKLILTSLIISGVLVGCQSVNSVDKSVTDRVDSVDVKDNMQEPDFLADMVVCPMNYDPVCAEEEIDGNIVHNTYSNDCTLSNAKGKILSSTAGACN